MANGLGWRTPFVRLTRSYRTVPAPRHWGEAALLLAIFVALALPVGLASGLLAFVPLRDSVGELVVFAVVAFFVPSLFEETLFRALLLPHTSEQGRPPWLSWNTAIAVALFVVGHPLVAWLFAPAARELFYDGTFLSLCAVFGLASSLVYWRSGSIWPSVAMHWSIVMAWKLWFGGWIMAFGPA